MKRNIYNDLLKWKKEMLIDEIRMCYKTNKSMNSVIHEMCCNLYRIYHVTGGMPESVKNFVKVNGDYIKYDKTIIENIQKSYFNDMSRYVTSSSETLKIEKLLYYGLKICV